MLGRIEEYFITICAGGIFTSVLGAYAADGLMPLRRIIMLVICVIVVVATISFELTYRKRHEIVPHSYHEQTEALVIEDCYELVNRGYPEVASLNGRKGNVEGIIGLSICVCFLLFPVVFPYTVQYLPEKKVSNEFNSELTPNVLYAEVEGEENNPCRFYLMSACRTDDESKIVAKYGRVDPQGTLQYTITLLFDVDIIPGIYNSSKNKQDDTVSIELSKRVNTYVANLDVPKSNYAVILTYRQPADWNRYQGKISATVRKKDILHGLFSEGIRFRDDYITLRNGTFDFTMKKQIIADKNDVHEDETHQNDQHIIIEDIPILLFLMVVFMLIFAISISESKSEKRK